MSETVHEIELPLHAGKPPLTMNQRLNRYEKARRTRTLREAASWQAAKLKLGTLDHVSVQLHYAPGDNRGRDSDNLVATQKPAVDGLVDAKLIPTDTPEHLTWWAPAIHPGPGKPRLWLVVHTGPST
ncbi:hypothetical protein [Amycolatopsis sp. Poz14]|uniref:hypothetical protein n=1 Tax=Amycolatopsis sp. Poz14 TaxID=1447705 RepID=UPI001EE78944|nr:hypothetical protein [Amycolatopsis sp. Poz14]MCG3757382.1 hypothetical protein [Amycolatopsis sp. Poz14]